MQKKVTARHFDMTPKIKEKAETEMEALSRFYDNIISVEMTLDQERHRKMAEVKVKVYNSTITATAETENLFGAIDAVIDKVRSQLIKYKGKLKQKNSEEITEVTSELTRPETDVDALDN